MWNTQGCQLDFQQHSLARHKHLDCFQSSDREQHDGAQTGTDQVIFEENSMLLNTMLALILISGFASAVLLFHQVWAPFKEKQNLLKTATSTENELEETKDKQMEHLP